MLLGLVAVSGDTRRNREDEDGAGRLKVPEAASVQIEYGSRRRKKNEQQVNWTNGRWSCDSGDSVFTSYKNLTSGVFLEFGYQHQIILYGNAALQYNLRDVSRIYLADDG